MDGVAHEDTAAGRGRLGRDDSSPDGWRGQRRRHCGGWGCDGSSGGLRIGGDDIKMQAGGGRADGGGGGVELRPSSDGITYAGVVDSSSGSLTRRLTRGLSTPAAFTSSRLGGVR